MDPSIAILGTLCRLRPYRLTDVEALRASADDPLVSRWMPAGFPQPYTRVNATGWVCAALRGDPPAHYVIEVGGEFAGSIGVMPHGGEKSGCAEFGYWLGRRFWGRGIASDAARLLADYALGEARALRRLEATVFAPNAASARVLEKAGFRLEGRLRDGYVQRDGTLCDGLLYGRLASDPAP